MTLRIAYLEDDPVQAQMISDWVENEGYHCDTYNSGKAFINTLHEKHYDLLLLDWELPGLNGIDVLESVRNDFKVDVPVIFITQHDEERYIVEALDKGADDFLKKPVLKAELIARIRANSRRTYGSTTSAHISSGLFRIDAAREEIYRGDEQVDLTSKEYALTVFLFFNMDKLVTRNQVLEEVWGINASIDTRTVDVHISRIRKALPLNVKTGFRIKTVYNRGYRLEKMEECD